MDPDLDDIGFSFAKPGHVPKKPFESIRCMKPFLPSSPNATSNNYTHPPVNIGGFNSHSSVTPVAARPHGMFPSFRFQKAHPLSQSILPPSSPSPSSVSTGTAMAVCASAVAAPGSPSTTAPETPSKNPTPQLPFGGPGRLFLPTKSGPFQTPTSPETPFASKSFGPIRTHTISERQSHSSLSLPCSMSIPRRQGNMVMSGTDAPKETMATENSHKHNRGRVEPPMKDTVRDDERHHREVRRVDKEHAIEVEERHAYEPDNGDGRMEVEDKEPYGSTIRQQRTDEDRKDANNMDRGEQRRDVENGQQNHPSQENSGQDEIGLSRHDQYQYELHEGRHPDSPPSQAADNNLHLLQHDTYNSSQRLGHGPSLPPNQEPHHIKYNFHKTPGQSPCSSSFGSLSNPKPAVDSISFLHGVSDHDRSGPATAMSKPSPLPLTEQPQRKDNDVRQGKPALSKATADLRVELNKEGGSEQMLLMMLQSKNGEINSLVFSIHF